LEGKVTHDSFISSEFWKDKRVIVTGGAGFLGSFVVEKLHARGAAEIIVPRSKDYDLRNIEAIRQLFSDIGASINTQSPEVIVIHAAARAGGIGINRKIPAEFFYDNLMMGVQLLHESWHFNIGKFVAIGTVCSYPKITPVPFKEENLWAGYPEETNAPYGLAKKMMLVQSQAYRQQYNYNSIFLMPTNLYGPKDNFDLENSHVIPALIRKCIDAKDQGSRQIVIWGTGVATREYLYVEDAAEGILLASERYSKSEPVNLGSGFELSIRDLAEVIMRMTNFEGDIVLDRTKPDGQPKRNLDTSRALREFGFQAHVGFEEGLKRTIDWYLYSTEKDLSDSTSTEASCS